MSNRRLSWNAALRDIKSDRATRAEVRCEPITASRDKSLIAWRGRSGCRYVFRVLPAATVDASDLRDMVVLGVDADGDIVGAYGTCSIAQVEILIAVGAVTIHLHSLCDTLAERTVVAADLRPIGSDQTLIVAARARGADIAADLYGDR